MLFDRQNKTFSIVGPSTSDEYWTNKTCELQAEGMAINCQIAPEGFTKNELINDYLKSYPEYKYQEKPIF